MPESNGLVLVEVGQCPRCGHIVESADDLRYRLCGIGHESTHFELIDTYAMDARKAWDD